MIRPFLIALQFLTRLPVRCRDCGDPRDIGRSLVFYPVVGALIGFLLAGIAWLSMNVPEGLRATLVLVAWVFVTGMLHLDGLADSADGWLGGHGDRERTLAIMKDPRTGTAGVVLVSLVLLLKYNTLLGAITQEKLFVLVATPLLARAMVPLLFLTTPYVRAGGLGESLSRHLSKGGAWLAILASMVAVIVVLRRAGTAMAIVAAVTYVLLRWLMVYRIGGTTGDTAGAMIEITEAAVLAAAMLV